MRRRRLRAGLVAVALLGVAWGGGAEPAPPSLGGDGILRALERSPVSVVARVTSLRSLDAQAWAAQLEVESAFLGSAERGARLEIAWEELSPSRPSRFAEGERILVSLETLPPHSIWSARIPDPKARVRALTPAQRGTAFVREPRAGALRLLEHYLALPPKLRIANPGVAHLALLSNMAGSRLATAAVTHLGSVPDLDAALDPTSAGRIVVALVGEDQSVSDAALVLVATRRPEALRMPLVALASDDAAGPARAYEGLALLDGELPGPVARALLERADSPDHRRVGARYADRSALARLPRLLRVDPDPTVRAAALERLVELEGIEALDRILFALDDPDPGVRAVAMQEIGELGEAAVPSLQRVVAGGSSDAARTAVGALRATGAAGMEALNEIADSHPDESVRMTARIALGRPIGHMH